MMIIITTKIIIINVQFKPAYEVEAIPIHKYYTRLTGTGVSFTRVYLLTNLTQILYDYALEFLKIDWTVGAS